MAWPRSKGRRDAGNGQPPPPPRDPRTQAALQLPVLTEDGTYGEREAQRRLRRAEADIRRLERREARQRKGRVKDLRAADRRLARRERSKRVGPLSMVALLSVLTGVAVAVIMLSLWWPDQPLYDPVLYRSSVHHEVVIWCFAASTAAGLVILSRNPSPEYQDRARSSLQVYFSIGLISVFSGLLLAHVLEGIEPEGVDWEAAIWVLLYVLAASAGSTAAVYAAGRLAGNRAFLSGRYQLAMGALTAVFLVGLVLLPFLYLPYMGWMLEAGTSLIWAGLLMMAFSAPLLLGTLLVEWQAARHLSGAPYD